MTHFLLQKDHDVSTFEKIAVRHASMIADRWDMSDLSLADALAGKISTPRHAVPVGSVEFVQAVAAHHAITLPPNMSYPACLRDDLFMRRQVFESTAGDVLQLSGKIDLIFVKPRDGIKTFTGGLVGGLREQLGELDDQFPVYLSEPVKFLAEYRYYISNNQILGYARYDDCEDAAPVPCVDTVVAALVLMKQSGAPRGYSLDFGVLEDGSTALVEANDGWALGYYKGNCSYVNYAVVLKNRWSELASDGILRACVQPV